MEESDFDEMEQDYLDRIFNSQDDSDDEDSDYLNYLSDNDLLD